MKDTYQTQEDVQPRLALYENVTSDKVHPDTPGDGIHPHHVHTTLYNEGTSTPTALSHNGFLLLDTYESPSTLASRALHAALGSPTL